MPYDGPGVYRHYKGSQYRALGLAKHTETPGMMMVVYVRTCTPGQVPISGRDFFVRPLEIFNQDVDGTPRFVRVG